MLPLIKRVIINGFQEANLELQDMELKTRWTRMNSVTILDKKNPNP